MLTWTQRKNLWFMDVVGWAMRHLAVGRDRVQLLEWMVEAGKAEIRIR